MPVTSKRARELALSFPDTTERPHFDRTAFRTPRKTFATLAGDGSDINLMFDADLQEFYCEQSPEAFTPVPGVAGAIPALSNLMLAVLVALLALAAGPGLRRRKSSR